MIVGDVESALQQPTDGRVGATRSFARDVAVNVAGNVVTAGALYLVGVMAGLLPKSAALIVIDVSVLGWAAGVAISVSSFKDLDNPKVRVGGLIALIAGGVLQVGLILHYTRNGPVRWLGLAYMVLWLVTRWLRLREFTRSMAED